jgi:hypothetical protein
MSDEKVVAVYDTVAHAEDAVNMLKSAGYSPLDIRMMRNKGYSPNPDFSETGFWYRLFGRDITHDEFQAYVQSAPVGSMIVSIRVPASEAAKIIQLLGASVTAQPLNPARRAGVSDTRPIRVLVPPSTSATTFFKAK